MCPIIQGNKGYVNCFVKMKTPLAARTSKCMPTSPCGLQKSHLVDLTPSERCAIFEIFRGNAFPSIRHTFEIPPEFIEQQKIRERLCEKSVEDINLVRFDTWFLGEELDTREYLPSKLDRTFCPTR
jgi:hypothetical protein